MSARVEGVGHRAPHPVHGGGGGSGRSVADLGAPAGG